MSTYLLEIGTEELPAKFANSVLNQFKKSLEFEFDKQSIQYKDIICTSTPRRIAIFLDGLIDFAEDLREERKGPKALIAFSEGNPTNAAKGFAKSLGISVNELIIKNTDKGEFVFGTKVEKGKSTQSLLITVIPKVIKSLQGPRFMKWGHGNFKFSRPIRSIISLYNDEILEFELGDCDPKIIIGRTSKGHRLMQELIEVDHASNYFDLMKKSGISIIREERKEEIRELIKFNSDKLNFYPDIPPELLDELTDLVEAPNLLLCRYSEEFLKLPAEVLCTVMKIHQRYVPLFKEAKVINKLEITSENILSTLFLCVSNGLESANEIIKKGNEKVLKARFSDANFFIESDKKISSNKRLEKLKNISYLKGLGTIYEKVQRIEYISENIFHRLQDNHLELAILLQAAKYCKHDLCSEIVNEFPELQGLMGGKYLYYEGFSEEVSLSVSEHYLPTSYKDDIPKTKYGAITSVSDKLETLLSIFMIGIRPTGSSDPYALRRTLNAIILIIWNFEFNLDIKDLYIDLLGFWKDSLPEIHFDLKVTFNDLIELTKQRIISHLDEISTQKDVIKSICLSENFSNNKILDLLDLKHRVKAIQCLKLNPNYKDLRNVVLRVCKLSGSSDLAHDVYSHRNLIDKNLFEKESEINVLEFIENLEEFTKENPKNYKLLIEKFENNIQILSDLFDDNKGVLIMSDNQKIRQNRLNLISLVRNFSLLLCDFTLLNS